MFAVTVSIGGCSVEMPPVARPQAVAAPLVPFPPARDPLPDLRAHVEKVTGPGPLDCGQHLLLRIENAVSFNDDNARAAVSCGTGAARQRRPFWAFVPAARHRRVDRDRTPGDTGGRHPAIRVRQRPLRRRRLPEHSHDRPCPKPTDDLGMRKLAHTAAEDLLELIMRRYERASTLLTSNRPVDDWGKLLGDTAAVTALLDRLLHHAHVLKCGPRSWRTKVHTDLQSGDSVRWNSLGLEPATGNGRF
jgi:hypothetical protein